MDSKNLILLAVGAGALLLLSKKQVSAMPGAKQLPGAALPPKGIQEPETGTGGSDTDEGDAARPVQEPSGQPSVTKPQGFTLGSDPFPAGAMALVSFSHGPVWYTKHPTSGRWGRSDVDFSPTGGYKNIGVLARNHNVLEVQDTRGLVLWRPFVYNAYGYPTSLPLQSF